MLAHLKTRLKKILKGVSAKSAKSAESTKSAEPAKSEESTESAKSAKSTKSQCCIQHTCLMSFFFFKTIICICEPPSCLSVTNNMTTLFKLCSFLSDRIRSSDSSGSDCEEARTHWSLKIKHWDSYMTSPTKNGCLRKGTTVLKLQETDKKDLPRLRLGSTLHSAQLRKGPTESQLSVQSSACT